MASGWGDELDLVVAADLGEIGPLGEEAVAGWMASTSATSAAAMSGRC